MARPLALLLLVLLAGLLSCPGTMARYAPDCAKYGNYACPRDYHPVCGTDGETYGNECVLCLANRAEGWALRSSLTFLGCFIFLSMIPQFQMDAWQILKITRI